MQIVSFLKLIILIAVVPANCFAGTINVKKYGAKGDGKTDDTKAIQDAVNAAPENIQTTIYFPKGVYLLSSYTITESYLENYFIRMRSNITFNGAGKTSVIKLGSHLFDKKDTNATAQLFYGVKIQNITFSNLMIDMNGQNNLVPDSSLKNQRAIFIKHGGNLNVKNIVIKNNAGRNMIMLVGKGTGALVTKSTFLNGGHYVGSKKENKNQTDFTFVYLEWDSSRVINNRIEQQNIDIALRSFTGGVELHGSYSHAMGNTIIGCNPGMFVESSWYPNKNTVVERNNFINCTKGVSFWVSHPMDSILIKNNFIQLTDYRGPKDYACVGISMPNGNSLTYSFKYANASPVKNLIISGNTIVAPALDITTRTAGMVLHSISESTISKNTITGMNSGGVIIQGSKWGSSSVLINNNQFSGFKNNIDTLIPAAYIVIFDSYLMQVKNAPGIKNIIVSGNSFIRSKKVNTVEPYVSKKHGQFFGAYIALPDSMKEEIHFKENIFSDKEESIQFKSITPKQ